MALGYSEAGPACPSCGARKLRMRPHVAEAIAVCVGCGEQFQGLKPEQEHRVLAGEEERRAAMPMRLAASIEIVRRITRRDS